MAGESKGTADESIGMAMSKTTGTKIGHRRWYKRTTDLYF